MKWDQRVRLRTEPPGPSCEEEKGSSKKGRQGKGRGGWRRDQRKRREGRRSLPGAAAPSRWLRPGHHFGLHRALATSVPCWAVGLGERRDIGGGGVQLRRRGMNSRGQSRKPTHGGSSHRGSSGRTGDTRGHACPLEVGPGPWPLFSEKPSLLTRQWGLGGRQQMTIAPQC